LEFAGVLMMYPMRLAAAWGFMKMKKWGFQFFLISSYIYVFWWIAYMVQFTMEASFRLQSTAWGVTGWWIINIIYITPFFMIPFLHTVNRDLWKSEESIASTSSSRPCVEPRVGAMPPSSTSYTDHGAEDSRPGLPPMVSPTPSSA
jgi:hypothetical protein